MEPEYVERPNVDQIDKLIDLVHLAFNIDYFTPQMIGYDWLIIRKDEKIVACVQLIPLSKSVTGLINLCVHPDHRRNGYARSLLWYIFKHSPPRVTEFQLQVLHGNEAAVRLYQSEGFEIVPETLLARKDCINMKLVKNGDQSIKEASKDV